MKTFKTYIAELFDIDGQKTLQPEIQEYPGISVSKTYRSVVGPHQVKTYIDHNYETNKSDIKFYVDGFPSGSRRSMSVAIPIYREVLSHILHHIENLPEKVKAIKYSYTDSEEGRKKHKLYQEFGKKFNIPLEARISRFTPPDQ
jgi:hypothetical protein